MGTLLDGKGNHASVLMKELKAESEKKRKTEKRLLALEAAEEAKRAEHEDMMKELADKNYTYDDEGKLIIIEPLDSSSLPPPGGMNVGTVINDVVEEAENSSPNSRRGKRNARSPKSGSRGGKRPGSQQKKREGEPEPKPFFTVSSVAQPSFIQSMTISAGVSLKEGLRLKAGPEVTGDSSHLSRKDYNERRRRDEESYYNSIGGGSSIGGFDSDFDLDNQTIGSNESLTLDGTEYLGSPRQETELPTAKQLGDIDSLSGARKAKPQQATPENTAADAHEVLLSDPNWGKAIVTGNGISPSKLPNKKDPRQQEIIGQMQNGPNAKKRRDRMIPSAMIPQKDRSHLPAPPIGYSTGHGLEKTIAGGGGGGDDLRSVGSNYSKSNNNNRRSPQTGSQTNTQGGSSRFPPIDNDKLEEGGSSGVIKSRGREQSILGSKGGGSVQLFQAKANKMLV